MRKEIKIALKVLIALCLVVGMFFGAVYAFLFHPNFTRSPMHEESENLKYFDGNEEFHARHIADKEYLLSQNPQMHEITSFDGLKLRAYVFKNNENAGTVLLMHGFHSDPLREFATLARFFLSCGYNVVLPFQRAHGESEGRFLTFGTKERFDCRDWLNECAKIFSTDKPLYMEGISMGCATVLMASALDGLPQNLRAIVADCGFTTPYDIIYTVAKDEKHLPLSSLIVWMGNVCTNIFARFDLKECSTIDAMKKNRIPVLFIHGLKDDYVPWTMTWNNYEACKAEKEIFLVKDAKHAICNIIDYENYTSRVLEFFKKYDW